jgi:tetratricopeptide (TPR) repeat protein
MIGKKKQSAVLAKYFSMYKKNPRSKVFAPLAEAFRKLGMLDDAFKILKDGIRHHPNYTLGYIVLAHCYFDQGKFELTYNTLRPIVSQNADNISLQKIFAQACLNIGYLDEALDTYKYLLFMNPRDKFFAEQVKKLEDDLMVGHKKLSLDQIIKAPDMMKITAASESMDDDWVQVDFNQTEKPADEISTTPSTSIENEWIMQKPGAAELKPEQHPILKKESIPERSLEDDFYADEFEEYGDIEEQEPSSLSTESPIVSHTLIDLYCAQKYYDKAIELLEKILELNPRDPGSIQKLAKVKDLKLKDASVTTENRSDMSEEDGHEELISIIENQVKAKSPQELKLEQALGLFLEQIKDRAQQYR